MPKRIDCVVAGECCVDLPIRPVPVTTPLGADTTMRVDPIDIGVAGIVCNSGLALAKLGLRTAALACIGDDHWGRALRAELREGGVDDNYLLVHETETTSVTAVLVDEQGEHSFAFHAGASKRLTQETLRRHMPLFAETRWLLLGYYGLLSQLEAELPDLLPEIRAQGCRVALDTAGGGGSLKPLDQILPHLDAYVPSWVEAKSQTGRDDARAMIRTYRDCGCQGLLGIKMGTRGAILSPPDHDESLIRVEPVEAPGAVVNTTGAGDCFFAGLIAGLVNGLSIAESGRVGAAAGACSVTQVSGTGGVRDWESTRVLAGL